MAEAAARGSVTTPRAVALPRARGAGAKDYDACVPTPFAVVGLRIDGGALCALDFLPRDHPAREAPAGLASRVARELERYVDDPGHRFDVPLAPRGTPFQQRVWQALLAIPPGEPRTYGELAQSLGSVARAVGQACGSNPIALIIPCHRVTARDGSLGGFMHSTGDDPLRIKRWLLAHERAWRGDELFGGKVA